MYVSNCITQDMQHMQVREELRMYNPEYCARPHVVVLNKFDLPVSVCVCVMHVHLCVFVHACLQLQVCMFWFPFLVATCTECCHVLCFIKDYL